MKKLFLGFLACLAIAPAAKACENCPPIAPAPFYDEKALAPDEAPGKTAFTWEYSLKAREWSPLVTQQFGTLTNVPWVSTLDVSFVVGTAGGTNGAATLGGMLSKSFRLADQVSVLLGLTGRITQSRPPSIGGFVFGLSFNFNSR
jgi:hypothetical protein